MTTQPTELLERDVSRNGSDQLVEIASPVLQEIINYGTHIFDKCQRATLGDPDEDLPLILSYMHMLEMGDGVDVLLRSSAVHPAIPLVRSMFETLLGMDYIVERDSKRRSFAWLVRHSRDRLSMYRAMSTSDQAGRQLREELDRDDAKFPRVVPESKLSAAIENLERLLKNPNYAAADREYRKLKKKKNRPEWYSLYDGPWNLRDLAVHLRRVGQYEFLYRSWSTIAHGQDLSRWLTKSNGHPAFYALRNPRQLLQVANFAVIFLLAATRTMISKYIPTHNMRDWYVTEVRPGWHRIARTEVNFE